VAVQDGGRRVGEHALHRLLQVLEVLSEGADEGPLAAGPAEATQVEGGDREAGSGEVALTCS
jgi:hypothetical protein